LGQWNLRDHGRDQPLPASGGQVQTHVIWEKKRPGLERDEGSRESGGKEKNRTAPGASSIFSLGLETEGTKEKKKKKKKQGEQSITNGSPETVTRKNTTKGTVRARRTDATLPFNGGMPEKLNSGRSWGGAASRNTERSRGWGGTGVGGKRP